MTRTSPSNAPATPRTFAAGYVFGVPLGNLGWFASLLMAVAFCTLGSLWLRRILRRI